MKIAIISGSVRTGRNSARVASWVAEHAAAFASDEVQFEVVSLADYDLPLWSEPALPAQLQRHYADERVTRWSKKIDEFDAYVIVTPEYNHGVPGALKNAVDSLAPEWMNKIVAFVSYGADGGVRAVEQWRQIFANFNVYDIRATLALSLFREFDADGFAPEPRRGAEIDAVLQSVIDTARRWYGMS